MATPATEKKAAAPKAAAPKKKAAPAATEAKAPASGKKVTVVQIGSPIGRTQDQRGTLIGLGLNKMNRKSVLVDTPEVRGMINRVKHLVKVEETK